VALPDCEGGLDDNGRKDTPLGSSDLTKGSPFGVTVLSNPSGKVGI
jgi:hypothetical protein